MSRFLNRFFRPASQTVAEGPLAPAGPMQVVGDVHGRLDLLRLILDARDPDLPLICVGDYIDRGEQSAGVLRLLAEGPHVCLMGNHEAMMLDFLDAPEAAGQRWLRNGGLQTLASFGVAGVTVTSGPATLVTAAMALRRAMGDDLIGWLRALPLYHLSGNVAVVHAGADPARPIDVQSNSLVWGHADFARTPRNDGVWVVHGHTVVDRPIVAQGRVAIDTGAYATGALTMARIDAGALRFVSTDGATGGLTQTP